MEIFTKHEFLQDKNNMARLAKDIFIYPTDTIYGIGCDAKNAALVRQIREVKQSPDQPFSVISPSKDWIKDNLEFKPEFDEWLDRLPGPYTLIMNLKNKDCVSEDATAFHDTLGVRIPDNWFTDIVKKAGVPIITTSVNIHGEPPLVSIKEIPENIKSLVDFAVDDGVIQGKPSTIVDLTKTPPEMIKRR